MEELRTDAKLSSQEYWDQVLEKASLPRINSRKSYHYRVTMDFIDQYIRGKSFTTLLEVGCGSSGWLPYFAREYGLRVSGIDYSAVGCRLAEENLRLLKIEFGEIFCKDLFEKDCTGGKRYDIVFSYGVIEHFDRPEDVVRIFSSFLNPGGVIITLVPNLNGLMGSMVRKFTPDVYAMHRVITPDNLRSYHEASGLHALKTKYAGTLVLRVMPLVHSRHWLFRIGGKKSIMLSLVEFTDKVFARLFTSLKIDWPSRFFSPYIITVAEKEAKN